VLYSQLRIQASFKDTAKLLLLLIRVESRALLLSVALGFSHILQTQRSNPFFSPAMFAVPPHPWGQFIQGLNASVQSKVRASKLLLPFTKVFQIPSRRYKYGGLQQPAH
jgi:hypothetical protein